MQHQNSWPGDKGQEGRLWGSGQAVTGMERTLSFAPGSRVEFLFYSITSEVYKDQVGRNILITTVVTVDMNVTADFSVLPSLSSQSSVV